MNSAQHRRGAIFGNLESLLANSTSCHSPLLTQIRPAWQCNRAAQPGAPDDPDGSRAGLLKTSPSVDVMSLQSRA